MPKNTTLCSPTIDIFVDLDDKNLRFTGFVMEEFKQIWVGVLSSINHHKRNITLNHPLKDKRLSNTSLECLWKRISRAFMFATRTSFNVEQVSCWKEKATGPIIRLNQNMAFQLSHTMIWATHYGSFMNSFDMHINWLHLRRLECPGDKNCMQWRKTNNSLKTEWTNHYLKDSNTCRSLSY